MGFTSKYLLVAAVAVLGSASAGAKDDEQLDDVPERIAAQCGRERDLSTEEVVALPTTERQRYVACGLQGLATALNEQIRLGENEGNRFVGASASGMTITLEVSADEGELATLRSGAEQWRAQTCGDGDARSLIEVGGAYRFVFVDSSGVPLGEVIVDRC